MTESKVKKGGGQNALEGASMKRLGRLTRNDMKNVSPVGSRYPKVYICSAYAAYGQNTVQTNITEAKHYCKYAISQKCQPVALHLLYPQVLNDRDPLEREMGLTFGIKLLGECSKVWVFRRRDGSISSGMSREITYARRMKIPVVFINESEAYGPNGWKPAAESSGGKEQGNVNEIGCGHGGPVAELG